MAIFPRVLTRRVAALSAIAMLFGFAATAATSTRAHADDGCDKNTIVTLDNGSGLGRHGRTTGFGYKTAFCVANGRIIYGQDFDIRTHDIGSAPIPDTLKKNLEQAKGDLAEAQRRTDLEEIKADIRARSPLTAGLRTDLPVVDLDGNSIAPSLDPEPVALAGARFVGHRLAGRHVSRGYRTIALHAKPHVRLAASHRGRAHVRMVLRHPGLHRLPVHAPLPPTRPSAHSAGHHFLNIVKGPAFT